MISLDEARAMIAAAVQPLAAVRVPLAEALGRVLREDICASEDLPAFDRSAMDGYAVALDDCSERFRVVAEIQPGANGGVTLRSGECARIFTGAAIPVGASQVIMQEDVRREDDFVIPLRRPTATHVRCRGEDARKGATLLTSGTRLRPAGTALAAQLGHMNPAVSPVPRIAHFTTGNELVDPSLTPGHGKIRDSNSALIATLANVAGACIVRQGRCGDSLEELVALIEGDATEWDLLLISGGASVGDYDFGARALEELGFEIHFRKINLRPGKPLVFATRGRQAAFVIPGNPVSHFVTFHLAIAHAVERLEGTAGSFPLAAARLGIDLAASTDARETWWPARLALEEGALIARPLSWKSSGDLCGIASTNALLRIRPGTPALPAGAPVECLLLDHRI